MNQIIPEPHDSRMNQNWSESYHVGMNQAFLATQVMYMNQM